MEERNLIEEIREKVENLLDALLIEKPPVAVDRIADFLSIPVIDYPNFPDSTSGIIINDSELLAIGVNSSHSDERKRFTIAHELGHYILGHDDLSLVDHSFDKRSYKEKEANKFAAELLMPKRLLDKDLKGNKKWTITELSHRYNVSEQAMSIRLIETKLLQVLNLQSQR